MDRISWVDNVKAIALFLVVLGHFNGLHPSVMNVVYSFHIPIFLFITGFLVSTSLNALSVQQFGRKYIQFYTAVYLFFSIVAVVLWYFLEHFGDNIDVVLEPLLGGIYGVHGDKFLLIHNNDPLWYFPFLIVTLIATYFIVHLPIWLGYMVALSYCAFSLLYSGTRLPWCIDIAGVGVFFCFVGYNFRVNYDALKCFFENRRSLMMLPFLVILLVFLVGINGDVNINRAMFGKNGFLYIINAVIGGGGLLIVAYNLPVTKLAQKISMNAMTIFCTHIYLVKAMRGLSYSEDDLIRFILILVYAFVILIICLLFSIKFDPLFKRYILRR